MRDYRRALDRHILPLLGEKRLDAFTPADAIRLQSVMRHTPTYANRAVVLLLRVLHVARLLGHSAAIVERPKLFPERKRETYLTAPQASQLVAAVTRRSPAAGEVIRLLLLTGCRRGEVLNLRWDEVDLDRGLLRLRDSKTGRREVALCPEAVAIIRARKRSGAYVFPGRQGERLVNINRAFRAARADIGLPPHVRIHDLRHTWPSLAVTAGVPLRVIGEQLGHRQVSTTMRYAHVAPAAIMNAAAQVGALLA
jgi:integrase